MAGKAKQGFDRKGQADRTAAISRLVRRARGSSAQESFAKQLGISQEMLSRYERGISRPPAAVVEACWVVLEERSMQFPPPVEELARRIEAVRGPEYVGAREAIARIIEISTGKKPAGRPSR